MSEAGTDPYECIVGNGYCQIYHPGHNMHFIHAQYVGRTPWGWRDGVVDYLTPEGWAVVRYLFEDGAARVWHHAKLAKFVKPGDSVRLHEQDHALGGPFGWVNVAVQGGLGPVPEPADVQAWAQKTTAGVVSLSTGRGLATDHVDDQGSPLREHGNGPAGPAAARP